MVFQKIVAAVCFLALVSAGAIKRQSNIPEVCSTQCTTVLQLSGTALPSTLCATEYQQNIVACISCIETNAPSALTPDLRAYLQSITKYLMNICAAYGSPIQPLTIPGATDTTSLPTDQYPSISTTPLSSAEPGVTTPVPTAGGANTGTVTPPASTTTTRSNARATTPLNFRVGGLITMFALLLVV